jgi:hypothetical protein
VGYRFDPERRDGSTSADSPAAATPDEGVVESPATVVAESLGAGDAGAEPGAPLLTR